MKQPVLIKGTPLGITVRMNPDCTYDTIVEVLEKKLTDAHSFFQGARMTLSFEGKELTEEQTEELAEAIELASGISVVYLTGDGMQTNGYLQDVIMQDYLPKPPPVVYRMKNRDKPFEETKGQFCRGSVRRGQTIESEGNLIVLGDVDRGAKLIASGCIIVLGTLNGEAIAGAGGRTHTFISAYRMNPQKLRIGRITADGILRHDLSDKIPRIAAIANGRIRIYQLGGQKHE